MIERFDPITHINDYLSFSPSQASQSKELSRVVDLVCRFFKSIYTALANLKTIPLGHPRSHLFSVAIASNSPKAKASQKATNAVAHSKLKTGGSQAALQETTNRPLKKHHSLPNAATGDDLVSPYPSHNRARMSYHPSSSNALLSSEEYEKLQEKYARGAVERMYGSFSVTLDPETRNELVKRACAKFARLHKEGAFNGCNLNAPHGKLDDNALRIMLGETQPNLFSTENSTATEPHGQL